MGNKRKNRSSWCLGVFAKEPVAGLVKSRLAKDTTPEWAARVAEAFLRDVLERVAEVPARRVLAGAPATALGFFAGIAESGFELVPQSDGDLGLRLLCFMETQFSLGAERVVVIGTDSPTLPLEFIEQAFDELDAADVVLGPATDGGYYLIGCRKLVPRIFTGIRWGGERVLAETVERVRAAKLRLALLPPWYDVDTVEDWRMLKGHLAALRLAGAAVELPRTEALEEPGGWVQGR
jgi:rSAM/selenodomain-associated transferase 1